MFTPESGFNGTASLSYSVSDGRFVTAAVGTIVVATPTATPIALGVETRVNTEWSGDQREPSISWMADGGFMVAWGSGAGGIRAQRHDRDGIPVGGEVVLAEDGGEYHSHPSIDAFTDGRFVAAWCEFDGGNAEIYARLYSANGTAIGEKFRVSIYGNGNQSVPEVQVLRDGGFVVTWQSGANQDGNLSGIYGRRYDASGVAVGGEFQVNTLYRNDQVDANVVALSDGGFVVVYESIADFPGDVGTLAILGQRFDRYGRAVGGEFLVNQTAAGHQWDPSVASLSDGGFVVAWKSDHDGGVYGRRYGSDGLAVTGEFRLALSGSLGSPDLVAVDDGGYVAVWVTSGGEVYGRRFDAANRAVGSQFLVNSMTPGDQDLPVVTSLGDGRISVAWQTGDGSGTGIATRVFSLDPIIIGGSGEDNIIEGTAGSEELYGYWGDDTINAKEGDDKLGGGKGSDTLQGGGGSDIYIFDRGSGRDFIDNRGAISDGDLVSFGDEIFSNQLWFSREESDLLINVIGTDDVLVVGDWYAGPENHVDRFVTSSGATLMDAQVESLVSAMAAFSPPPLGQVELTAEQHAALDTIIAANWKPLL